VVSLYCEFKRHIAGTVLRVSLVQGACVESKKRALEEQENQKAEAELDLSELIQCMKKRYA
jgi:hypothetical protein